MKNRMTKIFAIPALTASMLLANAPAAHAVQETILPLIGFGAIISVASLNGNNQDTQTQAQTVEAQKQLQQSDRELRAELGPLYEKVLVAMANQESPESLTWMKQAGPRSEQAFEAYVQTLKK